MSTKKKKVQGTCQICGHSGELSSEHIPPQTAFNDKSVAVVRFIDAIDYGPQEAANQARAQPGGHAVYTLCHRCNNNTGSWYGASFVDWCHQGMAILNRAKTAPATIYINHYIYPLRVIKQIITMFFSANGDYLRGRYPELVRFVLDRNAKYLAPEFRFFIYYNVGGNLRFEDFKGILNIDTGKLSFLSEIAYPPFGYVMTLDTPAPDNRLVEITHFTRYDYDEYRTMPMQLPVLPTHTSVPGDYRTFVGDDV